MLSLPSVTFLFEGSVPCSVTFYLRECEGLTFGRKSGILDCVSYKRTISWFSFFVLNGLVLLLLLLSLDPLLERSQRIVHRLSTPYPPKKTVMHSFIPIFGAKVVEKGIVRESLVQVHLFHKDFSLSAATYFIIGSWFVHITR
jgi:hypothetical protein